MADPKKATSTGRKRPGKNTFTTKSGTALKLNHSIGDRYRAARDAKARRRAAYLSTLPKNRFKRILFRMQPRQLAHYWLSRDGAIMALKIVGIGIVVCFLVVVGAFAYFRKDLPNIKDISGNNFGGSITYYDRTGNTVLWQDYNATKRIPVANDQISENLKDATVAIEDKNFYTHGAFDMRGIIRAGVHDAIGGGGGGVQGGSTISQQLVKLNEGWTADRSITRKLKEIILAVELEREYSKQDILSGYLNIAPYGSVDYGAQVAAQDYFGIDAKDLSVAQAAMLAAIPKAPSVYSPYGPNFSPADLIGRQHYILDQMTTQKMITKQQAIDAKKIDILAQVKPQQPSLFTGIKAPYFVLAAKEELAEKFGDQTVKRGGWKVITTLDLNLQTLAEQSVQNTLPIIQRQGGDEAAFVAEDNKTGQIVALVGGTDFDDKDHGQFNYATDANISPGSSFKPYDYATFIENHTDAGAGAVLYDDRTPAYPDAGSLPGYKCTQFGDPKQGGNCLLDYDWKSNPYPGAVTLRYALGGSRNVPAVKAMLSSLPNDNTDQRIPSINKVINTAEAMMGNPDGYRCYNPGANVPAATKADETQCYGSSAIGDGSYLHLDDHVNGLATLARLGTEVDHTYILKITDSANKTLPLPTSAPKQVLRADTAYIVNNMASDPNASYLPGSCSATTCTQLIPNRNFNYKFQRYNGWNFAVKTGTTNDAYDGLMASWSTQYTALTWVGYHTRTIAMTGNMETMTEPIVRPWMQGAHDALNMKPVNWVQPSDIKTLPAFVLTHKISRNGEIIPSPSTDLFPSWYQTPKNSSSSQTVDLVSGKLATTCTPDLAKKTEGGGNVSSLSADVFVPGGRPNSTSASTTSSDDVHNCNDAKPVISINTPPSCQANKECDITVTITQGTHPLSGGSYTTTPAGTLTLLINGQTALTNAIPAEQSSFYSYSFPYTPTDAGSVTAQVQAVDSVLYSSTSDSSSITITSGGGGGGGH